MHACMLSNHMHKGVMCAHMSLSLVCIRVCVWEVVSHDNSLENCSHNRDPQTTTLGQIYHPHKSFDAAIKGDDYKRMTRVNVRYVRTCIHMYPVTNIHTYNMDSDTRSMRFDLLLKMMPHVRRFPNDSP